MNAIPRGLATNAGLTATATAALGAIVNLLAGGPLEATVTPLAGAFATLLTVLIGRYAQAVRAVPRTPSTPAVIWGGSTGSAGGTARMMPIGDAPVSERVPADKDNSVLMATEGDATAPGATWPPTTVEDDA